jgi:hypothetical protein
MTGPEAIDAQTIRIARVALEASEELRSRILEIVLGKPGDGEYPVEWQTGGISAGPCSKAIEPNSIAVGLRVQAGPGMVVIDLAWCRSILAALEAGRHEQEGESCQSK